MHLSSKVLTYSPVMSFSILKNALLLVVITLFYVSSSQQSVSVTVTKSFRKFTDGRCLPTDAGFMSTTVNVELECAVLCNMLHDCAMFMVTSDSKQCVLYSKMNVSVYNATSHCSIGKCSMHSEDWDTGQFDYGGASTYCPRPEKYRTINATSTFVPPQNATAFTALCIGGGGGGAGVANNYNGGGGGSGLISYDTVNVTANTIYNVQIGSGGASASHGTASYISSTLINGAGGRRSFGAAGGSGGSGGGGASGVTGKAPGSGGTGGSNGTKGYNANNTPGEGQTTTVWSLAFQLLRALGVDITAGDGGPGIASNLSTSSYGGGGGGGILIDGVGLRGMNGSAPGYGGIGGIGYGAGGGGGGTYNGSSDYYGGSGAAGICVIAWIY